MNQSKNSLGAYLKQQREAKGLSIDEAAIETNIAKKYIEALENDEYGFFPAEMYVTGFLTAYVEVLEMDRELVLSMYQRSLAKEQEAPLEEVYSLYTTETKMKKNFLGLMIALPVILVMTISLLFFRSNSSQDSPKDEPVFTRAVMVDTVDLNQVNNETNTFTFGVNTEVSLIKDGEVANTLTFLGVQDRQIRFQLGQNTYTHKVGDILSASLLENGDNNLGIEIVSLDNRDITIVLTVKEALIADDTEGRFTISSYARSLRSENVIAPITDVLDVNMTIKAEGVIWLEYEIDNGQAVTQVLNPEQIITISFQEYAKVLIGNAGRATITFNGLPNVLRGGVLGEASYSIFYRKQEGNTQQLVRAFLR